MPVNRTHDRRGRPPTLTREGVLDAAMARLDAGGAAAITFRGLASDLGVSPMALYGHVTDKDELLLALVDRLAERLEHPPLPAAPRTAILTRWQTLYDGLAQHPWLPEVLARRRLMARSVLPAIEDIHAALGRAGMPLEQAIRAYRIMWEFTLGALLVRAGTHGPGTGPDGPGTAPATGPVRRAASVQAELRGAPDPQRFPTLAASARTWRAIDGVDTYAEDLAVLLDGMLAGARAPTSGRASVLE